VARLHREAGADEPFPTDGCQCRPEGGYAWCLRSWERWWTTPTLGDLTHPCQLNNVGGLQHLSFGSIPKRTLVPALVQRPGSPRRRVIAAVEDDVYLKPEVTPPPPAFSPGLQGFESSSWQLERAPIDAARGSGPERQTLPDAFAGGWESQRGFLGPPTEGRAVTSKIMVDGAARP